MVAYLWIYKDIKDMKDMSSNHPFAMRFHVVEEFLTSPNGLGLVGKEFLQEV